MIEESFQQFKRENDKKPANFLQAVTNQGTKTAIGGAGVGLAAATGASGAVIAAVKDKKLFSINFVLDFSNSNI